MSKFTENVRVTPSVLDRLLDFDPRTANDPTGSRTDSVAELRNAVLRDLEWLLNTRHGFTLNESLVEAKNSFVRYGLPDFTGMSITNHPELMKLTRDVEEAIRFFEPRFLNFKLTFDPINATNKQLKFRVEGLLNIDPAPEPMSFDTVLSSGNGRFAVIGR